MTRDDLPFSLEAAEAHLRAADPVLGPLIDRFGPYKPRRGSDPYGSLLRAILFQQLAGTAARAIQKRFLAIYGEDGRHPSPESLLATSDEQLRLAGVSRQKAAYMKDLASHVAAGLLDFRGMQSLSDTEVIERLTAVKGIGEWTAHMFLMFELARPDVLPVGDLGVRNGMRVAYGLAETPSPARAKEIGAAWAPFRSVASWYMWRVVEILLPVSPPSPQEQLG